MRTSLLQLIKNFLLIGTYAALFIASGCTAPSSHGASKYFEGEALQLAIAAENGDSDTIKRLVNEKGVNPDLTFARRDGIPIVAWPLRARNLDGLKALLEAGANPNARESRYMNGEMIHFNNAVIIAAMMDDPRYLDLLLKHGGDPNVRNINNETLLFQAFISGNQWENVKLLVANGADVNESNLGTADTVLSWYTARGGFDSAYWLLEHGADPTLSSRATPGSGKPATQFMVGDIYWEITTPDLLPWQKKCQQWLIAHNIPRPPMPEHIRKKREAFGFPSREEDIPLL